MLWSKEDSCLHKIAYQTPETDVKRQAERQMIETNRKNIQAFNRHFLMALRESALVDARSAGRLFGFPDAFIRSVMNMSSDDVRIMAENVGYPIVKAFVEDERHWNEIQTVISTNVAPRKKGEKLTLIFAGAGNGH